MKKLPHGVEFYRKTKVFDQDHIPGCFKDRHNTKENVWGEIHVVEGELNLVFEDTDEVVHLKQGEIGIVPPQVYHSLDIQKEAKLYVAFHR
jgi:tellurite resistance-related uncharacterized protein